MISTVSFFPTNGTVDIYLLLGCTLRFVGNSSGKILFVSHLIMLPFIIGILWQLHLLFWKKVDVKIIPFDVLAVLAVPHLASQLLLISPGVCLVFFYLLALNSIQKSNPVSLGIAVLGLILTS